jgi:hypothetical protein
VAAPANTSKLSLFLRSSSRTNDDALVFPAEFQSASSPLQAQGLLLSGRA